MPATPSTEVFAFSAPLVKRGGKSDIVVTARVPGGQAGLHGTYSVWRNLFEHLRGVFEPEPIDPAGNKLTPYAERLAKYHDALKTYEAGNCSQQEACDRHGVNYGSFATWLKNKRAAEHRAPAGAAEASARRPVTKPAGHLL
jgi:hypothetical protein